MHHAGQGNVESAGNIDFDPITDHFILQNNFRRPALR
jgi:hypothetical protein